MFDDNKPSNILLKKAQEKEKRRSISRTLATIMERNKILQKQIPRSGRRLQKAKRIIQKAKRINLSKRNSKNKTRLEQAPVGPQPREIRCGGSRSPWLLTNLLHLDNDASLI